MAWHLKIVIVVLGAVRCERKYRQFGSKRSRQTMTIVAIKCVETEHCKNEDATEIVCLQQWLDKEGVCVPARSCARKCFSVRQLYLKRTGDSILCT